MGAAVSVTRRFLAAYEAVRDQPEVAALRSEVAKYNAALEDHGLRDNQVTSTALGGARAAWLLVFRVVLFLVYIVVALPGTCPHTIAMLLAGCSRLVWPRVQTTVNTRPICCRWSAERTCHHRRPVGGEAQGSSCRRQVKREA